MVSVIIPVFNTKPYLGACINSVKRQSSRRWECILVNDGSTDDSLRELYKLTKDDDRFTIVSFTDNRGLSAARNAGMEWAKGEFLFFLDSDDWIEPDAFDCLLGEAKVHPDVGRIVSNYIEHWPGRVFGHTIEPIGFHSPTSSHLFKDASCDVGHSTGCLYIRENMPDIEFPTVKLFEDMIFNMGLLFSGASIFVMNKYTYHYMRRDDSLLSKDLTQEQAQQERDALNSFIERFNPPEEIAERCRFFLENAMRYRTAKY